MNIASILPKDAITRYWRWGLPLAAAIIGADQLSKAWVLGEQAFNALGCLDRTQRCGGYPVIGPIFNSEPFFSLTMTWNRGVSFGVLQAEGWGRWALFLMTCGIAAGFTIWLLRSSRWTTALALSMVLGGAIGNMIDRARFGAVVDFLDFSGLWFPWIFNVADAGITVGAALLLLDQLLASGKSKS
jgi:signal peptidase II